MLYFELDESWKPCAKILRFNKNVNGLKNGTEKWKNKIRIKTKMIREI
jgi:hypothetical protein